MHARFKLIRFKGWGWGCVSARAGWLKRRDARMAGVCTKLGRGSQWPLPAATPPAQTSNRQQQLAHLWLNMASIKLHLLFSLQTSANRAGVHLTGPTCFHRNGGGFRRQRASTTVEMVGDVATGAAAGVAAGVDTAVAAVTVLHRVYMYCACRAP